jgi:hypothetical protein
MKIKKHFDPLWYACVKNFFSFTLCGSQEVPETPKNFVMVSHSSRQANLSWGLPYDGQSPLLAFHLEFQRPVGKFWWAMHRLAGALSHFFLSLTNSINSFFFNLNLYEFHSKRQEMCLMSLKTTNTTYFHDFYSKFLHLRNSIQGRLVHTGSPIWKSLFWRLFDMWWHSSQWTA